MSTLFISHSSRDNSAAAEMKDRLEEMGHNSVFLDLDPEVGLKAGVSWERTLYAKLRACRAVIALCSDNYLSSHWCFAEVALARMEGKDIFTLKINPFGEKTQLPSILREGQYLDFRSDKDAAYKKLETGFKAKGIMPEERRNWSPGEAPYPGLRAFEERDAPIFFGRDTEARQGMEMLNRMRRQGHPRMAMVLGTSGSGKSSLTRAAIVPSCAAVLRTGLSSARFDPAATRCGKHPGQLLPPSKNSVSQGQSTKSIHRWRLLAMRQRHACRPNTRTHRRTQQEKSFSKR